MINDNNYEQEMARNSISMKRCTKAFNLVGLAYLIIFGITALGSFMIQVLSVRFDLRLFFFGVCLNLAIMAAGYLGAYKKNDVLAFAAPLLTVVNAVLSGSPMRITAVVSVVGAVVTIIFNREYRRLEGEVGFPYFNERFEEQKAEIVQTNIKDKYTQSYEDIKRRTGDGSGKMDEL